VSRGVAVLDSGVDAGHPLLRDRAQIVDGPTFTRDGLASPDGGARDKLGHGTAVAATIAAFTDSLRIHSLRVFDRDATCDFAAVLHALRHALELDVAVVNVSLGTTSLRYRDALDQLVQQARERSIRIVAPASYGGLPCDPGNLAGVEAVVGDANVPPSTPELRTHGGRLIWFASPLPPRDADGPRRLLARGDSLAVAAVSGCLLRQAT